MARSLFVLAIVIFVIYLIFGLCGVQDATGLIQKIIQAVADQLSGLGGWVLGWF